MDETAIKVRRGNERSDVQLLILGDDFEDK
jgi:hypothetical protein